MSLFVPVSPERSIQQFADLGRMMPTGVTVTPSGRTFACFPRWVDKLPFTVAELRDGTIIPYPNAYQNKINVLDPANRFISVQSVYATNDDTLWVLDTGRAYFLPSQPGGAKLVEINLADGAIRNTFVIPYGTLKFSSYLNDVRIASTVGKRGVAFITDSATLGSSALIIIDLDTGTTMRRLDDHPSMRPDPLARPVIEQEVLELRFPFGISFPYRDGADGIAMCPDQRLLYFCPLSSRRLYSLDLAAAADPARPDSDVATTIRNLGEKCISDGLECGPDGSLYASDLEHNQILRYSPDGDWSIFVSDPRLQWTDTLYAASDGYLYFK